MTNRMYDARGQRSTRIAVLKNTMYQLLDDLENNSVNVGLMSLRYEVQQGNVLKPLVSVSVKEINNTVRDDLKGKVNALGTSNYTPVTMSLYDAARYLTNAPGKHNAWAIDPYNSPSPIVQECQSTHLVFLTDGAPNRSLNHSAIKNLTGSSCSGHQGCAEVLSKWMYEQDQSPLNGKQRIITHTISFANGHSNYLQAIADANGKGLYRIAINAPDLLEAFQEIISPTLQAQNATMVNSSVSPNIYSSKSRREHKAEEYYPLFKPDNSARWVGNFKKYGLDNNGVTIDAKGNPAFDASGAFNSDARSFWSNSDDGGEVGEGGAVSVLPNANMRRLFVHKGSLNPPRDPNSAVDLLQHKLDTNNTNITNPDIKVANKSERDALFDWIRSKKMGDPMHSSPTLFSYGCSGSISNGKCNGTDKQMAIIGTNEGFVHLFDTHNGEEQFAFMPGELLKNIKRLKDNGSITSSDGHLYGMDNTVTVWANDKDGNGNIEKSKGEHVYAYATMRRGGRGLYALDITESKQPKLLWKIIGGETPGFAKLGYTWSQPYLSKIIDKGQEKDVLIFAGGYHNNNDTPASYQQAVNYGNDIYIINAKTGELIWSVSSSGLNLNNMNYSIPGKIYVLHTDMATLNKKPYAQALIFADTGGQIWRLTLNNGEVGNTSIAFSVSADDGEVGKKGVIAYTGSGRRFYHTPSVVVLNQEKQLAVSIGSGYHARPLNTDVHDRFYSIRVPTNNSLSNAIDLDNNNILIDVTDKVTKSEGEETVSDIAGGKAGWYIRLTDKGEKVMSSASSQLGTVFFNTYVPGVKSDPCQPATGTNYLYAVNLLNGMAVPEMLGPGSTERRMPMLGMTGLPGDPYLYVDSNGKLYMKLGPGMPPIELPNLMDDGGKKTYWIDLQS